MCRCVYVCVCMRVCVCARADSRSSSSGITSRNVSKAATLTWISSSHVSSNISSITSVRVPASLWMERLQVDKRAAVVVCSWVDATAATSINNAFIAGLVNTHHRGMIGELKWCVFYGLEASKWPQNSSAFSTMLCCTRSLQTSSTTVRVDASRVLLCGRFVVQ